MEQWPQGQKLSLHLPGQYEWPLSVVRPQQVPCVRGHSVEVSVDVVQLAVLHVSLEAIV